MTEAILTGEQVEEFPLIEALAVPALILAEIAGFPKNFLVRNGPRHAGDGETQQQEEAKLMRQRLTEKARLHVRVLLLPAKIQASKYRAIHRLLKRITRRERPGPSFLLS
jgi:hypothetical protein